MKLGPKNYASYFAITIILTALLIGGCKNDDDSTAKTLFDDQSNVLLKAAASNDEFENNIKTYFTRIIEDRSASSETSRITGTESDGLDTSIAADSSATESVSSGISETVNVSGTNLVESGVDEADLVKSDGRHAFLARQGTFNYFTTNEVIDQDGRVTADMGVPSSLIYEENRTEPASIRVMSLDNETPGATELTTINLPERVSSIIGLYLSELSDTGTAKQLIAITRVELKTKKSDNYFYSNNTWVVAYDVSNPESPSKQWEFEVEGYHQASRSMNGKLYLISSKSIWIDALNIASDEPSIIRDNKNLIKDLKVEDILPSTWVNGVAKDIVTATDCMVPQQNSRETVFSASLLAIYTIPINAPEETQSFCTLESSLEIYASTNAIYFTKGEYVSSDKTNESGKHYTVIHKLKFTDDNVVYQSSTRVPGWTGWRSNSFRLSEKNDDLRIVVTEYETTQTNANGRESDSIANSGGSIEPDFNFMPRFIQRPVHRLYILREDPTNDNTLSILSQLPNNDQPAAIGKPGEDIYAVRYFGEYAYIVTFQRTDPLYAINLKDPAAPFIEGELSIPGFSSYLHPINDNLLLGVGKEATEEGRVQGIKISLFDISDKSNPATLNDLIIGRQGSDSALSYDYRAFAILSNTATGIHKIALPISVNDTAVTKRHGQKEFTYYQWSYSGLQLLEIDDGSQSATASMSDVGVIKALESTKENEYHYVRDPRSVIANDAIHYIESAEVWSAMWDQPNDVNGPN